MFHVVGDGEAGSEAGGFDADEVDKSRQALVGLMPDDEIAEAVFRALELGPDAGRVRKKVIGFDVGEEVLCFHVKDIPA